MNTLTEQPALVWLCHAARMVSPEHACVELGVFRGGSLAYLVSGARGPVYGVDTWGWRALWWAWPWAWKYTKHSNKAIAARKAKGATLIHCDTVKAAKTYDGPKVGLLYIDADHRCAATLANFHAWRSHLTSNAMIAFDDYNCMGVKSAIHILQNQGHITLGNVIGSRLYVASLGV